MDYPALFDDFHFKQVVGWAKYTDEILEDCFKIIKGHCEELIEQLDQEVRTLQ